MASTSGINFRYKNWELNLFTGMKNLGVSFSHIDENKKYTTSLSLDTTKLKLKYENSYTVTWAAESVTDYANITANGPSLFLYGLLSTVMEPNSGPVSAPSRTLIPTWG